MFLLIQLPPVQRSKRMPRSWVSDRCTSHDTSEQLNSCRVVSTGTRCAYSRCSHEQAERRSCDVCPVPGARPPRAWWPPAGRRVVAVGALLAVLSLSGGVADVLAALERVSPGWMLAAAVAMVGGYALLALHMRRLASRGISVWQAARADLLLFGVGNVLPGSPAPGGLLAAAELRRDGLSPRHTRFVLAFTMWFNVRTLLGIGAIAFLVAFARQHPGVRETGLWWLAAVGLIAALAISAALAARPTTAEHTAQLFARLRVTRPRPPADVTRAGADTWHAEAKATVGSRRNRIVLVVLAAGSWLADATCLWLALAAAGVQLDADVVLLAYVRGDRHRLAAAPSRWHRGGRGCDSGGAPLLRRSAGRGDRRDTGVPRDLVPAAARGRLPGPGRCVFASPPWASAIDCGIPD